MNLDVKNWKPFKIQRTNTQSGLFIIESCKCGSAGELDDGTDINYIGAKKSENGVMRSVSISGAENLVSKGHGIMLICDGQGSVGYANYMDSDFIGSTTTSICYDDALTKTNAMFLVTVLDSERFKYSYGRKYRKSLISAEIYLPVKHNDDGTILFDLTCKYSEKGFVPDWQFMEDYIKSLHYKPITTQRNDKTTFRINTTKWENFKVENLFSRIYKAKAHTKEEVTESKIGMNFVSRTEENNGIDLVVQNENLEGIEKGNCITIGDTTATCFYQRDEFITGDHMVVLRSDWMNQSRGLFIVTLLNCEKYRYCYGRAFKMDSIKSTSLKLPVKKDEYGNPMIDAKNKYHSKGFIPDWEFMEDYINSLPYSDRI